MTYTATQVRLATRPQGMTDDSTWEITQEQIPDPAAGQVVVEVDHLSLDPAMRGWLNDVRSYIPPVGIGEVMRAHGTGTVVASENADYPVGTAVAGMFGASEYALCTPAEDTEFEKLDTELAPAPTWLGALGMPGMTAYFGLLDVGRLQAGDTVLVSGAAGAVGSVVGQLAKAKGAKVIGIAGGPEKCDWLREIGFDGAVDYKNENPLKKLRELAPKGIDVFFDNVGGEILDAGLANLARGARVVICGGISSYNEASLPDGPKRYMSLLVFRATMTGFVVFDFKDRYPEAVEEIGRLIRTGDLVARETVVEGGITQFPEALNGLFRGINTGKLVLKVK
ncbi:NADP-dependent oxidoreductase [Brevibacterium litoralis]|uniref:NADP-dependent oxidoreductase n=1 Tax=Brevibacterium litoralis TaxID=3138935 RepID=UPI0032EB0A86